MIDLPTFLGLFGALLLITAQYIRDVKQTLLGVYTLSGIAICFAAAEAYLSLSRGEYVSCLAYFRAAAGYARAGKTVRAILNKGVFLWGPYKEGLKPKRSGTSE